MNNKKPTADQKLPTLIHQRGQKASLTVDKDYYESWPLISHDDHIDFSSEPQFPIK